MHPSLSLAVAFAAALLLTPAVRAAARATGQVARPREDRWHSRPTALMGGVAIFLGAMIGALFAVWANGALILTSGAGRVVLAILVAGTMMFVTGFVDDLRSLRPASKLVLQALAAAVLVTLGIRYAFTPSTVVNSLLSFFWFIGVINAVNLMDNMDGAAAGTAGVGFLSLAALFAAGGDWLLAAVALAMAGATAGFLVFNFRPASIFMGDSGSLFLGSSLAALGAAYSSTGAPRWSAAVLVPVLVTAIPILDTSLVSFTRTRARFSIAQGGRDHVTHRLVSMGFSERTVALLLYAIAAVGGTVAYTVHSVGGGSGVWVGMLFLLAMVALGAYLSRLYRYPVEGARPVSRMGMLLAELLFKRRALEVLFDLVVFAVAYVGAYVLRYDATLPPGQGALMTGTIALAVACKSVAFALNGVYRGVWHQMGLTDVHRLLRATLLGSLLTVVAVVFGFREAEFSRTVFVVDGLLVVLLATGLRTSFRSLDHLHRALRFRGERALIYGAGRGGEFAVRELLGNEELGVEAVAFVDDDLAKVGCVIHGVPVLGTGADLERIVAQHCIAKVIVSTHKLAPERVSAVRDCCRAHRAHWLVMELVLRDGEAPLAEPALRQAVG